MKIQDKDCGDREWASEIMSRKAGRSHGRGQKTTESCISMLSQQLKAKLILIFCEIFFSANPGLSRERHLGHSQRTIGKVRGFADIQAMAIVSQGKEAKVAGFSPDQFATLSGSYVLQL